MTDGVTGKAVPDYPQTRLALRTWEFDRAAMAIRSVTLAGRPGRPTNWIAKAMAAPAGNWPHDRPLTAVCNVPAPKRRKKDSDEEPEHGPVPDPQCSCGIYATTDLDVINTYLSRSAPVLGVVELGGRLIPASQGYRAAYARVAVILLVDEALTEPHGILRDLAAAYKVPAVVPHSADPSQYRELAQQSSLASETEAWLRAVSRTD